MVIGTIGRFYPQKNQRLFLDMAKIVTNNSKKTNVQFLIIGDGPLYKDLKVYTKQLGLHENVVFTGEVLEIQNEFQNIDIFVMILLCEGIPNTIMEAMASGLPVVATDVGGNKEIVSHKITGFLCPSNNAGAIADRVMELLKNKKLARIFGENGNFFL